MSKFIVFQCPKVKLLYSKRRYVSALGATSEGGSIQAIIAETDQKETTFLDILSKKLKEEGVSNLV